MRRDEAWGTVGWTGLAEVIGERFGCCPLCCFRVLVLMAAVRMPVLVRAQQVVSCDWLMFILPAALREVCCCCCWSVSIVGVVGGLANVVTVHAS